MWSGARARAARPGRSKKRERGFVFRFFPVSRSNKEEAESIERERERESCKIIIIRLDIESMGPVSSLWTRALGSGASRRIEGLGGVEVEGTAAASKPKPSPQLSLLSKLLHSQNSRYGTSSLAFPRLNHLSSPANCDVEINRYALE